VRLAQALLLTVFALLGLVLLIVTVVSTALIVVWVGLPLFAVCLALVRATANLYRRFVRWILGVTVPTAYRPVSDRSLVRRPLVLAADPSNWRDLAWLTVNSTVGVVLPVLAIVESIVGLLFWWLPRSILIAVDAHIARVMLAPSEQAQLSARVRQLTESRAETVDTQAAELRRIERDLHDGAQARLVSVGLSLGLAEEKLRDNPDQARRLLAEARTANSEALAELRDLVRGIHPPVLADRGLVGAVQALALSGPTPVEVHTNLDGRLPARVESAAYFAVAEALANAVKHSGATTIDIGLTRADDQLRLEVRDDGRGGANPENGSGLRGVEQRLAAFDGTVHVYSPSGGPTVVVMELPLA
jgi:signal transduction histidine kinase